MTEPTEAAGDHPRPRRERLPPAPVLYADPQPPAPVGPVRVVAAGAALLGPRDAARRALVQDAVSPALRAKDPTLWGPAAEGDAAVRLGWVDLPATSRALLPELAALRDGCRSDGLDRVVLCGMGGSSLAPEVICATEGLPLVVLDSTDPHQVGAALVDLERTVVVVSSKSGSTIETECQRLVLADALRGLGLDDAAVGRHFVAVTDPGSALAAAGEAAGFRAVVLADPDVGGRYSALSAFGLVPAALAGADVARLLDDAAAAAADLGTGAGDPGLDLGAALGGCAAAGRDKLVIADAGAGLVGFGDWAEQLIAESTGKDGSGILPVVVESPDAPGTKHTATNDVHVVLLGDRPPKNGTAVSGPLGGQLLVWEWATAVAGRVLGSNPFDQPDVEEAKVNARALLDSPDAELPEGEPAFVDGPVAVFADAALLHGGTDLPGVLDMVVGAIPPTGYLAVMAYLDRVGEAALRELRPLLAARTPRPVTFGWGPRFLHSTGQYHKGGPRVGCYLQVTGAVEVDISVPGQPFTLGRLQLAQALGDLGALRDRGRPAVRLHLLDRAAGVAALLAAARPPEEEAAGP